MLAKDWSSVYESIYVSIISVTKLFYIFISVPVQNIFYPNQVFMSNKLAGFYWEKVETINLILFIEASGLLTLRVIKKKYKKILLDLILWVECVKIIKSFNH